MTTSQIASSSQFRHRHPRTNGQPQFSTREKIAKTAENILLPDPNVRGVQHASKKQLDYAKSLSGVCVPRVQALRQETSAWSPIVNKHAIAPLALLAAHHGTRYWMLSTENAFDAAIKRSLSATLASGVVQFTMQWFLAEACRIMAEPMARKWESASRQKALAYAERVNKNDIRAWAVEDTRSKVNSAATLAPEKTREATRFVTNTAADLLTLAVYTSTIWGQLGAGVITAPTLLGPMAGAILLFALSYRQEELTKEEQKAEAALRSLTASYADNVQLGNDHNLALWQKKKAEAERIYEAASWARGKATIVSELSLVAVNGAAIMLPFAKNLRAMDFSSMDAERLRKIPKVITRLNQISHRTIDLGKDFTAFTSTNASLQGLKAMTDVQNNEGLSDRITKMLVNSHRFSIRDPLGELVDLEDFLAHPERLQQPGRWTIRAANGSGKSTLLNVLKVMMPEEIHYIPVKHSLMYEAKDGSAGQTQIGQLAETIRRVYKPILAIDEWPANLDVPNTQIIDGVLQQFSEHACVVEVRNDEDVRAS